MGRRTAAARGVLSIDLELNDYGPQEDAFGPRWIIGFNITPVVHNFVADLFRNTLGRTLEEGE